MVKKASLLPTALSLLPLLVAALPTSDFVVSSASSSAAPRDAAVVRAETLAALWRSPRAAASLARIASAAAPLTSPQQIRLSPAHAPGGMRVTWATGAALPPGTAASVSWWPEGSASNVSTASAVEYTYSAGEGGWGGALFTAIMTPLAPGVTYAYRVASGAEVSDARSFSLPPEAGAAASARIAVCADMGTIVPLGWAVADRLIEDHLDSAEGRYDAVLLAGDLSYSTVSPGSCSASNPGCDSLEFVWDFFGVQIEPFSSTAALLTAVGNHENVGGNISYGSNTTSSFSHFAAYEARFRPFSPDSSPFWYASDVGPVHFIFLSSEHPSEAGTPQGEWLRAHLAGLDKSVTPWVVAVIHRPIYSAAILEWADHSPGSRLSRAFEPLFRGIVDVVLSGHIHSFDRTHPVYNGTVMGPTPPANASIYVDPTAPIYICAGTSGALPENVFIEPPPVWSAQHINGAFGYGRIVATGAVFHYEFVGLYGEVLDTLEIRHAAASLEHAPATRSPAGDEVPPPSAGSSLASALLGDATLPQPIVSLLAHGGKGDGVFDNSDAFASAVAAVASNGGGTLLVPAGSYLTRPLNLTSSMTLYLDAATIQASTDVAAWPLVAALPSFPGDGPRYAPLIWGVGLHDVTILGNASALQPSRIDGAGLLWYTANELHKLTGQRPHAIEMLSCTNFELAHVSVLEAAFWSVHPVLCEGVYVHDVVVACATPNGDGIDPDGSSNVLIENVDIDTGDDAIAIKSGTAAPGAFPPSTNITIRHARLSSGEACVAIGSEMTGGVSDVVVGPNVTCALAGHGVLYIKERQMAGGYVRDVLVHDVAITGPVSRMLWLSQHFGEHGENVAGGTLRSASGGLPVMERITLANISVTGGGIVLEPALLNGARAPPGVSGAGAIVGLSLEHIALGDTLLPWSCVNVSGTWEDVVPAPCPNLSPSTPEQLKA